MNAAEFQALSTAILRSTVGWQTKIARHMTQLGYDKGWSPRNVRRWIAADKIPDHAASEIKEVIGLSDIHQQWPRGEWLVGDSVLPCGTTTKNVIHLQVPRFVARVVFCDPDGNPLPEERPADVLSGTVFIADGSDPEGDVVLCEIAWIDEPKSGEVIQLLEAAANAYEQWEDRL